MLAFLPGLLWAVPFVGLVRLIRQKPSLDDVEPAADISLSVIVPARNEADNIEAIAASILASTHQPLQLILVDDRSTDDTAARMATVAAQDSRVLVVHGGELPDGWFGKPWACAQGAAVATGTILLFTDADTRHTPGLAGRAIAALQADRADLLTLTSHQLCVTFWERVVMPQVMVVLGIRFAPQLVNRATRPDQVVANGQFIMVPRASYDALGGHAAVKDRVVEDLALAQRTIRLGRRLRVWYSGTLLTTRMYRGLGDLIEGWSKNLSVGARESAPDWPLARQVAPWLMLGVHLFWLLPLVALAGGIAPAAAITAIAASALFWCVVAVGMQIPAWYGLTFPLGATMMSYIVARSIWRGSRRIEWRGRRYSAPPT